MKNKVGLACMLLGVALVLAALALFLWNRQEDRQAKKTADQVLPQLMEHIEAQRESVATGNAPAGQQSETVQTDTEMTETVIDGYAYVGYLRIPDLGLELPVMSQWDEVRLKIAPCRYSGSTKADHLVIAGHNYVTHFGHLKYLAAGNQVEFTDMDGELYIYEVVLVETLPGTAVEEMTAGEYALTLFTCTYSGQDRVAVRCNLVG